ncbi:MAG: TetR/AcrR family transcriptional regulator, partial [Bryobacteraceae bacterium]
MNDGKLPATGGLRGRKKQQTKQKIAAAAAKLFKTKGFTNVRMVDIARAADVSEQTLYNYFPTKEHLIFDLDQEFEARLISIVIDRDPGTSLTEALRAGALEFLTEASRSIGKETGIPASVAHRPELRRVWVEMNARHADSLAGALLRDSGGEMHRARAKVLARSIVAIFAVILEELYE